MRENKIDAIRLPAYAHSLLATHTWAFSLYNLHQSHCFNCAKHWSIRLVKRTTVVTARPTRHQAADPSRPCQGNRLSSRLGHCTIEYPAAVPTITHQSVEVPSTNLRQVFLSRDLPLFEFDTTALERTALVKKTPSCIKKISHKRIWM